MSSSILGVEFLPGLQDALISDRGSWVVHEVTIACTCQVEDSYAGIKEDAKENRREPFCPRCGGDGWLSRKPKLIQGLVTGIRQQRNILDAGWAQPGDMVFSPHTPNVDCEGISSKITTNDKITFTWEMPLDSGQVIVRGAATSGINLQLKTYLTDNQDRIWYEPFSSIWCEDDNGRVYHQDSDFKLGPGKVITWIGNQPLPRQRYTLKYNAFFEWIAFQPPTERRDVDNVDLGNLIYLRKRHIAFVNSSPFAAESDLASFKSRVNC